ncbi:hypothetical protein MNBD_CPR01-430 [hydrothermal vent metagenome]|uniref:Baseplate protein J-like domain-containing protein n=1 Tax=hydrothermal vent metagenome TaxID=652676 RepID=A0A3B0V0E0_9ZZZZ
MRKTFEDIIPPSRRRNTVQPGAHESSPKTALPTHRRKFSYTPAIVSFVIIIIVVMILYAFSGASVEIEPMTATANLSGDFTAMASTTTPLPFGIISVQKIVKQTVKGNGTEAVHQAAHGTITIYNTRPVPQKLVTKTRFETKNGLIFRIRDAIVVPKAHGIIPGSVKAVVYADTSGSQYNISPSSFTLPGLSGTSLARKVYARSTSAMTGGFSGTRAKISPDIEASVHLTLQSVLAKNMAVSIQAQVPEGYVLIEGAATTTYKDLPTLPSKNGSGAEVREQGTTFAVVFPKSAFARLIATNIIGSYSGQPVTLTSTKSLTLIPTKGIPNSRNAVGGTVFNFALSGNTTVVWTVNKNRISTAIAGKSREEAKTILKGFPEVKQAHLKLHPVWSSYFPSDPKAITVVINNTKTSRDTGI